MHTTVFACSHLFASSGCIRPYSRSPSPFSPPFLRKAPHFAVVVARPLQEAGRRCRLARLQANSSDAEASGDSDVTQVTMTATEAYELLGLSEGAKFDDVLRAKNKLAAAADGDPDKTLQLERAYDVLFMKSMQLRLTGESVPSSVRFADVPRKRPATQQSQRVNLPFDIRVETPANKTLASQSAVFAGLAVWALIQAVTEPPTTANSDVAGLQLALGVGAAIYFLRENKRAGFGKAAGLTGAGFLVGSILGGALQSWLRVDIVPIGGFSSPGILVGEFALLGTYLSCTFLR